MKESILYVLKLFTLVGVLVLISLAIVSRAEANDETHVYVEISQGIAFEAPWAKEVEWEGDYPTTFRLGVHHEINSNWYVRGGFEHKSNIARGAPFNNKPETYVDEINITIGYRVYLK